MDYLNPYFEINYRLTFIGTHCKKRKEQDLEERAGRKVGTCKREIVKKKALWEIGNVWKGKNLEKEA